MSDQSLLKAYNKFRLMNSVTSVSSEFRAPEIYIFGSDIFP